MQRTPKTPRIASCPQKLGDSQEKALCWNLQKDWGSGSNFIMEYGYQKDDEISVICYESSKWW